MAIYFFAEDVSFALVQEDLTAAWVEKVINLESTRKVKVINYVFCSDKYLLEINKQYLEHNTLTDIITFDNSEVGGDIEADIFISIERVKENALMLNLDCKEELHRVIIHGLLHLFGYNDKTPDEKAEMREKEDACLSLR